MSMNVSSTTAKATAQVLQYAKECNSLLGQINTVMLGCVDAQVACAQAKNGKAPLLKEINDKAEAIQNALQILINLS